MLKRMFCLAAIILVISSFAFSAEAKYYPKEKPVVGLTQDTAYLLNKGEWYLDLWGWTTYGFLDDLQLGSNFWLDVGQLMNIYVKKSLVTETQSSPAISLGASYYSSLISSNGMWDTTLYLTKSLDNDDRWLYGSAKYAGVMSGGNTSGLFISGESSANVTLGMIINNADHWRSFLELAVDSSRSTSQTRGGGGFEWAFDGWRFRLGGYISRSYFAPLIDFIWRF